MKKTKVDLVPLNGDDREQFILDNQWAFQYGALEEFGQRDDHVDEDVELEEHLIPRLSMQPLVENAIHHGLEGKMGAGTVTIKIDRTQSDLMVRVSDDGLGMSRENVLAIRNRLALGTALYIEPRKKGKTGIAIVNLNQRLKLIFGDNYGIDVSSIENVGTFFTITLPLYTQHDWEQTKEASLE